MSGGGAHDAEAGGSKGPTYWELLETQEQQRDPTFVPPADEEMECESSEDEMEEADAGHQNVEDASTTDGGDGGETTDGGTRRQQNPGKPKKPRKDRTPITVGLMRQAFTEVNADGMPTKPEEFVKGYANQVSAIMRNTVTINTGCLSAEENSHYRELLLRKLHARYAFPGEEEKKYNNNDIKGNPVNKKALHMMTTALARWKHRVKTHIFVEGMNYVELKKKEPLVKEEDYVEFKKHCETDEAKAMSQRGKEMYAMNIGTHHLGSGGYRTAIPKWRKEDEKAASEGKTTRPFDEITETQTNYFVRARCKKVKGSATDYEEPSDPKVQEFVRHYVSNLHASL